MFLCVQDNFTSESNPTLWCKRLLNKQKHRRNFLKSGDRSKIISYRIVIQENLSTYKNELIPKDLEQEQKKDAHIEKKYNFEVY